MAQKVRPRLVTIVWSVALGCLVLAEVALRVTRAEQLVIRTYPAIYEPDDVLGYRYRPGNHSLCVSRSCQQDQASMNMVFGGRGQWVQMGELESVIFGEGGTELYHGEDNYPNLLSRKLSDSHEVVNLSVDGRYHFLPTRELLYRIVPELHPRIVLLRLEGFPIVVAQKVFRTEWKGVSIGFP